MKLNFQKNISVAGGCYGCVTHEKVECNTKSLLLVGIVTHVTHVTLTLLNNNTVFRNHQNFMFSKYK